MSGDKPRSLHGKGEGLAPRASRFQRKLAWLRATERMSDGQTFTPRAQG